MIKRFKKQFWSNNSNLLCFVSSYYRNITYMSHYCRALYWFTELSCYQMYPNLDVGLKRRKIYNNTFKCIVPNMPHLKLCLCLSLKCMPKLQWHAVASTIFFHVLNCCISLTLPVHRQRIFSLSLACMRSLALCVCVCVCVCEFSLSPSYTHTHTHSPPAYMSMWIFCACVSAPSHH